MERIELMWSLEEMRAKAVELKREARTQQEGRHPFPGLAVLEQVRGEMTAVELERDELKGALANERAALRTDFTELQRAAS